MLTEFLFFRTLECSLITGLRHVSEDNMLEVRAGPDILEVKPRTSKHYPSVMTVCKEHLLKEL